MLKITDLKKGDIIFQCLNEVNDFNDAVTCSGATSNVDDLTNNINHVGLYIGNNIVIEATPKHGVIDQTLTHFIDAAQFNIIGRIDNLGLIENAIKRAKTCIGLPYNPSFRPNTAGLYCSELITYAFRNEHNESYFALYPMNFRDLTTHQVLPYWIDYYHSLKEKIPEQQLGSHPQQLLRQTKLFKTILTLE